MNPKKTNGQIILIILCGLVISQILSFLMVSESNQILYTMGQSIENTDYFFITPFYDVLNDMNDFSSAFFGGLFFSFTTGIFLTLISLTAGIIFNNFKKKGIISLILFSLFSYFIYSVSADYTFWGILPLIIFFMTIRLKPEFRINYISFFPVIVAITIPLFYRGSNLFLDVRDKVLLSSFLGEKVNEFYYQYTLYPAEINKSFRDKKLKLVQLRNFNSEEKEKLKKILKRYDYYISSTQKAGKNLILEKKNLSTDFIIDKKRIVRVKTKKIFSDHKHIFKTLYQKTGKKDLFQKITALGFLTGFPFLVYFFFFYILKLLLQTIFSQKKASILTSIILFLVFAILIKPVVFFKKTDINNIQNSLESKEKFTRLDALKFAYEKRVKIENLAPHLDSGFAPERYWAILNLKIRGMDDLNSLLEKTEDPSINVRCKAYEKIGFLTKNPYLKDKAIEFLKLKYPKIEDWYVQWYAYNASKRLMFR